MLAAVREKVADDAEAGTVTAGGPLRIGLFSEIVTETLLVTAADRATVQVEVLPEVIVAGVHAREVTVGEGAAGAPGTVRLAPVLERVSADPSGAAPPEFVRGNATVGLEPVELSVTVTVATTPEAIAFVLMPAATHLTVPEPGLQ